MTQLAEMRNDLDERELQLAWSDGSAARIPHKTLRARCPCAECRQGRRGANPAQPDRGVVLIAIEPYGPNAVQLKFSDGHARGLFPFEYLRELAVERHAERPVRTEPVEARTSARHSGVRRNPGNGFPDTGGHRYDERLKQCE